MSDAQQHPWSNNPNAPKIPYHVYFSEKADLAGLFIGAILYGTLVMLFFRCLAALLNPVNRERGGIKWGLVCYTVVMFSCATVVVGTAQNIASVSFIDNRKFPGVGGSFPPGPIGYQAMTCSGTPGIAPSLGFLLNYWLADGLLLYRCYIIYGRNLWVIAFPCLMYLATMGTNTSAPQTVAMLWANAITIATGILILASRSCGWGNVSFILPHLSVSVSLNLLLTLMIVIRLVLCSRKIRAVTGSRAGISGLCKTIAGVLVESSALYAVNSLLLIGLWAARNGASGIFLPTIADTQVIAALLLVQRVANRSALTSDTIVTGNISSFHVGSRRESTGGDRALTDVYPMSSTDNHGKIASELGIAGETKIGLHRDGVV